MLVGAAWVKQNPQDREGWLPRRGRPPDGTFTEDAARAALQAFLDQQTDRTPLERISFERCADGFLEHCRERGRAPTTLRIYGQIAGELKLRWQDWRAVDVDADELEDYRDELAERGLAGSTLNQRRAVLSGIFKVARRRFRVNVDPVDGFERAEVKDSGDSRSTASRRSGRSSARPAPACITLASAPTRVPPRPAARCTFPSGRSPLKSWPAAASRTSTTPLQF